MKKLFVFLLALFSLRVFAMEVGGILFPNPEITGCQDVRLYVCTKINRDPPKYHISPLASEPSLEEWTRGKIEEKDFATKVGDECALVNSEAVFCDLMAAKGKVVFGQHDPGATTRPAPSFAIGDQIGNDRILVGITLDQELLGEFKYVLVSVGKKFKALNYSDLMEEFTPKSWLSLALSWNTPLNLGQGAISLATRALKSCKDGTRGKIKEGVAWLWENRQPLFMGTVVLLGIVRIGAEVYMLYFGEINRPQGFEQNQVFDHISETRRCFGKITKEKSWWTNKAKWPVAGVAKCLEVINAAIQDNSGAIVVEGSSVYVMVGGKNGRLFLERLGAN